jgi:hypothetical protein
VPQHVQPYSAKQTTTNVQTLANGTTITNVTDSQMWRDTDGRIRQETSGTMSNGTPFHSISVFDPVERIRMGWTVVNPSVPQVVNLNHMPQPFSQPVQLAPIKLQPVRPRFYPNISESLPPQTIEGLYATGTRYTRTTPTGYEGNDRDITVTSETWTTPDLGIQLRRISDDPRNGKSTTEITDVQQTDPDPALFKAPEGYEIRDMTPTPAPSGTPAACNCPTPVVQQHFRPYVAMQRITNANTQADGTTITVVTMDRIWHDDVGRERNESIRTLPDGTQSRDDIVYDPVARIRMNWTVGKPNTPTIVTVHPFSQPVTQPSTQAPANPQPNRPYIPQRTESLPPQTVAGLYATGSSTTRNIPAGYEGNNRDIIVTQETWTSPDTGIQLRTITDDLTSNYVSTAETTDIQLVAPDPAVLMAPDGYQVQEGDPR